MVSAPGKVILFGEHAAVYGKPALAATISLRSYLLITTSKSLSTITLNFKDIGLKHTWDINKLPWTTFQQPTKKQSPNSTVESLDPDLLAAIQPYIDTVSRHLPETQRKAHIKSATAFLYLYLSLGSPRNPGFVYTLRSTIPIGAGLGSSASISVCLSTALLLQSRFLAPPACNRSGGTETQLATINRWAFVAEMCLHGDPSGVDNTVSVYGKAVLYQRNTCPEQSSIVEMSRLPRLPLLLVDTQQSRSTAVQVEKVRSMKMKYPEITQVVLDGIEKVTQSAWRIISRPDKFLDRCDALEELGALITFNHGLLVSLRVSHPRLERVRELMEEADVGWTKLTGAGGGGCAFTLVRSGTEVADTGMERKLSVQKGLSRMRLVLVLMGWLYYGLLLSMELMGVQRLQRRFLRRPKEYKVLRN